MPYNVFIGFYSRSDYGDSATYKGVDMLDSIINLLVDFVNWVISFLPQSPFASFIDKMQDIPYLGWLNWFIPVGSIIAVGQAWLVSVALFYLYSIIMRWIRVID